MTARKPLKKKMKLMESPEENSVKGQTSSASEQKEEPKTSSNKSLVDSNASSKSLGEARVRKRVRLLDKPMEGKQARQQATASAMETEAEQEVRSKKVPVTTGAPNGVACC